MDDILKQIDTLLAQKPGPHYAAFDADGTLWDNDVGENFFQYQIDNCNIAALQNIEPWTHYENLKKKHPPDAYLWLAQLCAGYSLDEVRSWSQKSAAKSATLVFDSQKNLIAQLLQRKIKVFVVSASVHWAVEGALPSVGLTADCAIGVKTKVINGTVAQEQDGPVTWREGKRAALLAATGGVAPLFCSGNSSGDIHLLESSCGPALAIQTQLKNSFHEKLFLDEQTLMNLAHKNNWFTHSFR